MLIVEDDPHLLQQLAAHFRGSGWSVDLAADGREGRFLGQEYDYEVAIVDLGLPDIPGLQLLRGWREAGRAMPVLILTARADWQDKVTGLEAGADDYVTKPFHLPEVEARVNALQRRAAGHAAPRVSFGPVSIDFSAREVRRDGQLLELTGYEYNTLAYLANHAGEVVSKADLTEHLYDQDFDRDSNVIEVFIGRLRRKLDPDGSLQPILTVRGAGYRFALERH
jgi:two-component system, OmpR family, response regulator PhoP